MKPKKPTLAYRAIRAAVAFCYPKITVVGAENLPQEPCIVVGNHAQLHGPIACELYFPGRHQTWCAGQMMELKEVPGYAFQDFWSAKPKYIRWVYKLLSYLIAPLSVCVFNNANTIGVYHDTRIISTFKSTVKAMQEGSSVIIFPECYQPYSNVVWSFQQNFVDVAKLYARRGGQAPAFVPLYVAPKLRQLHIGKPTYFDPGAPIEAERSRICRYLMDEITAMAQALPRHTVVPYPNMAKKNYPTNRPE